MEEISEYGMELLNRKSITTNNSFTHSEYSHFKQYINVNKKTYNISYSDVLQLISHDPKLVEEYNKVSCDYKPGDCIGYSAIRFFYSLCAIKTGKTIKLIKKK